ncbi:MAG: hypothetical protein IPJ27_03790 [Candidatus Accumulibacter sp.]|uniref:FkbM family methyltransferase n=1 Tax=Candidatus Accumulibacter proximus TaxID=2954385 RepID=A0A935UEU7_9PROT|nr:hypothetical protein [Candidatus Accumulibacter proximus]
MTATATLTMVDEVRVVVPDSLDLITPYVLLEQQDWFEDEIKFLRHLLQPGQKVIDIGANYGFTLCPWRRPSDPQEASGLSNRRPARQDCWRKELPSMALPRFSWNRAPCPVAVAQRNCP